MRVKLTGWLRHDGTAGLQRVALGGPPLSAGRYRVTVRSLGVYGVSKPVSLTFRAPMVTPSCNTPAGVISADTLGSIALGEGVGQAKTTYGCGAPGGGGTGYGWRFGQGGAKIATASALLLDTLTPHQRRAVAGKVILALTSSKQLRLGTVGVGSTAAAVRAHFKHHAQIKVAGATWYVIRRAQGVNLVRFADGRACAVGIATRSLADTRQRLGQLLSLPQAGGFAGCRPSGS